MSDPMYQLALDATYSSSIFRTISLNNLENFKNLLISPNEFLSENRRYAIAYSVCVHNENKKFLHCLIFEFNLKEEVIEPRYITDEVRVLFAQRKVQELNKELEQKNGNDKRIKV